MGKIKIAALQPLLPHEMKPMDRLKKQLDICKEAIRVECDYIFFPEYFVGFSYICDLDNCEVLDNVSNFANEHGVWLGINLNRYIDKEEKTIHNSVILIKPDGDIATIYNKMHPYCSWEPAVVRSQGYKFKLGDKPVVYDTGECKIGLGQCIELWLPDFMKTLGEMGAEIVYIPSRMPIPYFLETDLFARIRARENCNYVVVVGEAGKTKPGTYIAGPQIGDMIMDLTHIGNHEGVVYKTIDTDWLRDQRTHRTPIWTIQTDQELKKARKTATDYINKFYGEEHLKQFIEEWDMK
jgi:predicted amidohydrolase